MTIFTRTAKKNNKTNTSNIPVADIAEAIEFISADPAGESEAYLCFSTGKIHYRSPYTEEFETVPEDIDDAEKYLPLPHKHHLDLGRSLVLEFVHEKAPAASDDVYAMFRKRGAYARFKRWADNKGLLDEWHRFEEQALNNAIIEWCEENELKF